jgi:pyridoxamine 5'-phosphate oxidase
MVLRDESCAYDQPVTSLKDTLRSLRAMQATPPPFDPASAPENPTDLFIDWFESAVSAGALEPHSMTVSTIGLDGTPDARVVILKDVTDEGWWFASSSLSAKGQQLTAHPSAALSFYWPEVGRAVRLRGPVTTASSEENANDFRRRSVGAKAVVIGAPQSEPLSGFAESEASIADARESLERDPQLVSESWTLWCVRPSSLEFWQSDPDREHIRVLYSLADGHWTSGLLWP